MSSEISADRLDTAEANKPLYRQMKEDLVRRVMSGEWVAGQLVPSETALAQEYSVSVGTARKAIEELVTERLVVRQRGRGTTITRNDERYERFRFYRLHSEDRSSIYASVYLSCVPGRANAAEAKRLNLKRGAAVIRVHRLRTHEGRPVVVENIVLREDRCPNGAAIINNQRPDHFYSLLERVFHIMINRVQEKVLAVAAVEEDAETLGVAVGTPLLEVSREAFDLGGDVIECRRMRAVPGIHYLNEMP